MEKKHHLKAGPVRHLLRVLRAAGYYFGNDQVIDKAQIDERALEALQLFLLDSSSKEAKSVLKVFKSIAPRIFTGIDNSNSRAIQIEKAVIEFVIINVEPDEFEMVRKLLTGKESEEPASYPAVVAKEGPVSLSVQGGFIEDEAEQKTVFLTDQIQG